MNINVASIQVKDKIISFFWQHFLLVISLYIMTLGVALCVRSSIGSSVISAIPFVMTLAGESGSAPAYTIGEYTYIMNFVLVGLQVLILRRQFQMVQLFQLALGFVFGFLLDVNMMLTAPVPCDTLMSRLILQFVGCVILALGISLEIRCGSLTMPGEGITIAVTKATGFPFAKTKVCIDIALVVVAVALGYLYFDQWVWKVVGGGTLFAMIFVGAAVRMLEPHMEWFTRVLQYRPGFRRYVFGLARYLYRRGY